MRRLIYVLTQRLQNTMTIFSQAGEGSTGIVHLQMPIQSSFPHYLNLSSNIKHNLKSMTTLKKKLQIQSKSDI